MPGLQSLLRFGSQTRLAGFPPCVAYLLVWGGNFPGASLGNTKMDQMVERGEREREREYFWS